MNRHVTLLSASIVLISANANGDNRGDPDLIILKVTANDHAMKSVFVQIKNIGDAPATACHLNLRLPGFGVQPMKNFSAPVPAIKANHTAWVKIGGDTAFVLVDDQNHVAAARPFSLEIDPKFEVSELDEENNMMFFAPTAKGGAIKIPGKH